MAHDGVLEPSPRASLLGYLLPPRHEDDHELGDRAEDDQANSEIRLLFRLRNKLFEVEAENDGYSDERCD